jgi:glycine cleavage system protein P-like pyridoxal-binding family
VYGLSSWTSTAILRCSYVWLRVEPAVDVLYGPLRPYCHHQR